MKTKLCLGLLIALSASSAFADFREGGKEGGGVPRAPRAVVIQGHADARGRFDEAGARAALRLAGEHVAQDRVVTLVRSGDKDRTYLCIEYMSFADFGLASDEFKAALEGHESMEVVQNGVCRTGTPGR